MDGAFSYVFLFVTIFFFHASDGIELQLTPNTEQVKTSGSNIVLDCKLIDEGNVEAVVRWYNPNGEEIKNGNRTKIRKGSNFSKVYLINISAQDAGTYTCNTTFDGKPLEKSINLKIYKKHAFLNCSTYQQPIIHTNAKIGCIASGDPVPEVSWNYKGKIIKTGGRYHVKPDGLVIQNITEADNGNYVIESEITVRSEFIDRNIEVKVTIPPTITKPPVMSDPIKGSDFTMTCEAEGKPKPIYSWMKGGKKLDDERVSIDDIGGILKISSVKESDSGHYVCVAENVGGKVTAKAKVTVLIPPTLKPLENKQIDEGNQVTLQCVGDGVPAPSLTWQKGTDAPYAHGAQASDSRIIVTSENPAEKRSKLSLTIRNLKAEDAANYTCTATNSAGTQLKKSQLRVNYKPQIVNTPVVAYNWLNNKRNITCNAKGLPKPIISWQTKKGKINANDNTYEIFKEEGYELTIGNLQVSVSPSNYDTVFTDYQCVAINNVGQKQLDIKLKKAVVPRAPQKVNHMAVTPTTVTLVISPPVDNGGIAIDQYRIEYGTGGFHNQTDTFVNGQDKNEFTKVVLRQLSPETKYQIKVFAGNAVGLSTTFYDLSVKTLGVRKPYDVLINSNKFSPNPTSYTVTWHEPRSGGAKITSYSVQYRVVHIKKDVEPWEVDPDAQNGKFSAHTVKDTTSYVLHNLQPNTYYEVQVVAINAMGDSAPRPKIILTKEKFPDSYDSYEEPEYPEDNLIEEEDPFAVVEVPQQNANSNKDTSKVDLTKTPQAATTAGISEGGIVGVIIALLIIVLIVIDLGCYAKMNKGVTKFLLENVCKRGASSKDKSTDVEAGASQETNLLAEKEKKDGEANGEENKEPASDEGVTDEKNEDKDELMKDHTDEIEPDQKKDGDLIDQDPVKV